MARGRSTASAGRRAAGGASGKSSGPGRGHRGAGEASTGEAGVGHFLELNRAFPLRPIRSDEELARAGAVIEDLLGRGDLDPEEDDYLNVLSDLVEKYEDEAHPLPAATDAEMLRYLIEGRGVTQAEVAGATGIARSTLSGLLSGRRALNRDHIAALARYFRVSAAVFIPAR